MYKLSEEELTKKFDKAFELKFLKDVIINDAQSNSTGKIIGREVIFETDIGNVLANENVRLLKHIKKYLKDIFGKDFKQRVNQFGTAEFVCRSGRMEV